jgi:hypothetical protein
VLERITEVCKKVSYAGIKTEMAGDLHFGGKLTLGEIRNSTQAELLKFLSTDI